MPIINDAEAVKREAYRVIYPRRNHKRPNSSRTWGDYFKARFGEDIDTYHRRLYMKAHAKLHER